MTETLYPFDPDRDLRFERVVDVPRDRVWRAWTTPEYLKQWFTPAPWATAECAIDLRPGGLFRTVMRSPEGHRHLNLGTYLEVVPNERLVWTNTLEPGFRPAPALEGGGANFRFTAIIALADHAAGTRYTAVVMHGSEADKKTHADLGFEAGWGQALTQLVAVAKAM